MQHHLFSGEQIDDYLERARRGMQDGINSIKLLDQLEGGAQEALEEARIEPCQIDRGQAKFDVKEKDTGVAVTVTLPVDGDLDLLERRTPRGEENTLVLAERVPIAMGIWNHESFDRPVIRLHETFPSGASSETVRAWAKTQVDAIESQLAVLKREVEKHNGSLPAAAERMVAERRRVLDTGASLRDDLGTGI